MSYIWTFVSIFCLLGEVVCPGPDGHGVGTVPCYHCDHHNFPGCLFDLHMCHHDQLCFMSHKHGEIKLECRRAADCHHIHGHYCSPGDPLFLDCETCCGDQACVSQHVSIFQGKPVTNRPDVTTAVVATTTTVVATQTPANSGNGWERLLTGPCDDTLLNSGCQTIKSTICQDITGVSICPQTCGLCPLLQTAHGGSTTCDDRLVNNGCATTATQTFCADPVAESVCPKTCKLCESILLRLIQRVIVTIQAPVVTLTQTPYIVTQPVSSQVCYDHISDCQTLPDVCHNVLAPHLCKNYCGFCAVTTTHIAQPVTPSSSGKAWERLITGPCDDILVQNGCDAVKSTICQDPSGVSVCPETCGLCPLLQSKFHGHSSCTDQLQNNECAVMATQSFCANQLAEVACARTCNLCETILLKLIHYVVYTLNIPTQHPVTHVVTVTQHPQIWVTEIIVTYFLNQRDCFDYVADCATQTGPCTDSLRSQLCRKFCGGCDQAASTETKGITEKKTTDVDLVMVTMPLTVG